MKIIRVGVDLAKNVFHLHGVDRKGKPVWRRRLTRARWPQQQVRDQAVIDALNAMVENRPRWGFWKCYDRLRLDGHRWNHKRVHRVYKAMKLNLPRRTKRRLPQRVPQPMNVSFAEGSSWSASG